MILVSATAQEFSDFLTKFNYTSPDNEGALLSLSFVFLRTLPVCKHVLDLLEDTEESAQAKADMVEAQCFIAWAMTEEGGEFNPSELAETKTTVAEGLGRSAITEKFEINKELHGTDSVSMLKRVPLAYGLMSRYLCTGYGPAAFVV